MNQGVNSKKQILGKFKAFGRHHVDYILIWKCHFFFVQQTIRGFQFVELKIGPNGPNHCCTHTYLSNFG